MKLFGIVAALAICTGSAQAATLTSTGATNVDVRGTLYDVSFVDGTCVGLFSGCDSASDFFFGSDLANAASQALMALINLSTIDANPDMVSGCGSTERCSILTPYDSILRGRSQTVFTAATDNWAGAFEGRDGNLGISIASVFDTTGDDRTVFGVWTASATPAAVPVPAAGLLLATALFGSAALRRRKRIT